MGPREGRKGVEVGWGEYGLWSGMELGRGGAPRRINRGWGWVNWLWFRAVGVRVEEGVGVGMM